MWQVASVYTPSIRFSHVFLCPFYLSMELGFIVCFQHFMHICNARHYSTLRKMHYRQKPKWKTIFRTVFLFRIYGFPHFSRTPKTSRIGLTFVSWTVRNKKCGNRWNCDSFLCYNNASVCLSSVMHVLRLNGASYSKTYYGQPIGSGIWGIDWYYQNEWPWPMFRGHVCIVSLSPLSIQNSLEIEAWFQRTANSNWPILL